MGADVDGVSSVDEGNVWWRVGDIAARKPTKTTDGH